MKEDKSYIDFKGIIIFLILLWLITKFGWLGFKHEDRTAEEWFNKYDWLVSCVEVSSDPKTCI